MDWCRDCDVINGLLARARQAGFDAAKERAARLMGAASFLSAEQNGRAASVIMLMQPEREGG
jgi:hypothetical protein